MLTTKIQRTYGFYAKALLGISVFILPCSLYAQDPLTEDELNQAFEKARSNFSAAPTTKQLISPPPSVRPTLASPKAPTATQTDDSDVSLDDYFSTVGDKNGIRWKESQQQNAHDVELFSTTTKNFYSADKKVDNYRRLDDITIAVDVQNKTLKQLLNDIVDTAEDKTGPWTIRWRLKDENKHIINERVNLTAETTFDNFMEHLSERIVNMTGVRLFVNVFDVSRVIIISDTYY